MHIIGSDVEVSNTNPALFGTDGIDYFTDLNDVPTDDHYAIIFRCNNGLRYYVYGTDVSGMAAWNAHKELLASAIGLNRFAAFKATECA